MAGKDEAELHFVSHPFPGNEFNSVEICICLYTDIYVRAFLDHLCIGSCAGVLTVATSFPQSKFKLDALFSHLSQVVPFSHL